MSRCRYSGNKRNASGPEISKPMSMKTFQDFGGRVLSGYGRAHGIMSRGRHYV